MPKSKSKRGKRSGKAASQASRPVSYGGVVSKGRRRWESLAGIAAVVAVVGWFAWSWWDSRGVEARFQELVAEGQPALEQVESEPNRGRSHLGAGETHLYPDAFPTSGPHDQTWINPGFYTSAQPPTRLVHSLEHGHIVIYYDDLSATTRDTLESWTDLYSGRWQGVLAVPKANLGDDIVLTAWTKKLRLDTFEPATAAAFVDAYRGRGPEQPVR